MAHPSSCPGEEGRLRLRTIPRIGVDREGDGARDQASLTVGAISMPLQGCIPAIGNKYLTGLGLYAKMHTVSW